MTEVDPPQVLEIAQAFYAALEKQSKDKQFRGYTTREYKNMGLPIGYYTRVKAVLEQMGCIVVEKIGARNTPSEWWLLGAPTQELYDSTDFAWHSTPYQLLVQRIEVLEQQMKGLLDNG